MNYNYHICQVVIHPDVRAFVDHPEAIIFRAPEADPEAPELQYKEKKDREKKVTFSKLFLLMFVNISGYYLTEQYWRMWPHQCRTCGPE